MNTEKDICVQSNDLCVEILVKILRMGIKEISNTKLFR